jgi:hypothetical protein
MKYSRSVQISHDAYLRIRHKYAICDINLEEFRAELKKAKKKTHENSTKLRVY